MESTAKTTKHRKPARIGSAAANGSCARASWSQTSHDAIAIRAHELYAQSGYRPGREVEFWLEAERQLQPELDM